MAVTALLSRWNGGDMCEMILSFMAEVWELEEHDRFTFGSNGDLFIDDHPDLDGCLGTLTHERGSWYLRNASRSTTLTILPQDSEPIMQFPGCSTKMPLDHSWISFTVGGEVYEIKATSLARSDFTAPLGLDEGLHGRWKSARRRVTK